MERPEGYEEYLGSTTVCVSRVHISKVIPKGETRGHISVYRAS